MLHPPFSLRFNGELLSIRIEGPRSNSAFGLNDNFTEFNHIFLLAK